MWWWTDECAPALARLHCLRNFHTASAIAQLILLARPDNHGIDGTGLDNSRLSGFPPMRRNKNHAWNCLVTNDAIQKDWNGFTRSYPALPVDKSPRRYLFKTATDFRPASEITWQARTKKQLKGHKKRDKSSQTSSSSADQNLIRKIIRLLRLKLLCTIETPLDDEIRSQIKTADDDICGNTKIEFSVQQGQCHNFVKTRTESTLRFLTTKIQCHEFQLAHSETVILDLSGNPVFILSEVLWNMSTRSSVDNNALGELRQQTYQRRWTYKLYQNLQLNLNHPSPSYLRHNLLP